MDPKPRVAGYLGDNIKYQERQYGTRVQLFDITKPFYHYGFHLWQSRPNIVLVVTKLIIFQDDNDVSEYFEFCPHEKNSQLKSYRHGFGYLCTYRIKKLPLT